MIIYNDNLDLTQIANSGQCFRWVRVNNKVWKFPIYDVWYKAWHDENNHSKIHISKADGTEADEELINYYFDIDTNYQSIINEIPKDDLYLKQAADAFSGIRILRQDLWEMMVSFIISQNNNIPRIKKSIEKLCDKKDGKFPDWWNVIELNLSDLHLGYREEYLKNVAWWFFTLSPYTEAILIDSDNPRRELKQIKGIGDKVADCICLFGLHRVDSCPIDTWMKKIIETRYNGTKPEWMNSKYAGVYQQYVFAYERSLKGK